MRTHLGTVVLIALAAGCGRGRSSQDAAPDGSGGGSAGMTGGAGRGGRGGVGGGGVGGGGGSGAGRGWRAGQYGAGRNQWRPWGAVARAAAPGSGTGGSGGNAGQGGSGGTGGSGGRGGTGGGGGNPAGVSYLGCTFIGGINRVVVSKRDTAGNQCLSLALTDGRFADPTHAGAGPARGLATREGHRGPRVQLPDAQWNARRRPGRRHGQLGGAPARSVDLSGARERRRDADLSSERRRRVLHGTNRRPERRRPPGL